MRSIHSILVRAVCRMAGRIYRAYGATFRTYVALADGSLFPIADYQWDGAIYALSERDALALAPIAAERRFTVLVAKGRDGDLATMALEAIGCHVVRGSSRHDGAGAFADLLDAVRTRSAPVGFVVDGPLGPVGEPKRGAMACGLRTGRPVKALGAAARPCLAFPRTWSGIYLPAPFARLIIACADPVPTTSGPRRDRIDSHTSELAARLAWARDHARARLQQRNAA